MRKFFISSLLICARWNWWHPYANQTHLTIIKKKNSLWTDKHKNGDSLVPGHVTNYRIGGVLYFWLDSAVNKRSVQFSSVQSLSCVQLCEPMNCSMPGLPVHHQLPEFTQSHVYRVGDAIQPSHPLSSPSPPAPNPSQHLGLFKWVSSSHEVAKVLEFQLHHQFFQWTPRTDLL